jgi:Protein of unknown function (DUF4232)
VLALGAVGMVAGCTSGSTSSPTTTSTIARTTEASSTTSTTSTTVAGATRCVAAGLTGSVEGTNGVAGTIQMTVALKNTATTSCSTGGYPGLQLVDASGQALPTTTVRGGSLTFEHIAPMTLTVPAGGTVWFNIGYSDVPHAGETSCPTATQIQVIPPNDTTHLTVDGVDAMVCNHGTLVTSPLFGPGSPGSQTTAPPS